MHLLALDIGTRRTGVAFGDTTADFIMALATIEHSSTQELCTSLQPIIAGKKIAELVIGLPRLPGGEEGKQAELVRSTAEVLTKSFQIPVTFIDERFSSMDATKEFADAKAACSILEVAIAQWKKKS